MAISPSKQTQIAFKNLLGKSQTSPNLGVNNENYGLFFNVPSSNVWSSKIPINNPEKALTDNVAVEIVADLRRINDSLILGNYAAYEAIWGLTPSGTDPRTNSSYSFGKGSLSGISIGDTILDLIPPSYGWKYKIIPYLGDVNVASNQIADGDPREWVFQYSSGVFYQEFLTFPEPKKIKGYYYLGSKLSTLNTLDPEIVRISATGPDSSYTYTSVSVFPSISTYSSNQLYLVDFANGNTNSVFLKVGSLATQSVYKWNSGNLVNLTSGDITGSTGSTSGQPYYLTWDSDGYFIFNTSNPTQRPGTYKSTSEVSNPVGGIKFGDSFNEVSLQDMFTDLLYPEQLGNFTSLSMTHPSIISSSQSEISLIDVGRSLTGTVTFSWVGIKGTDIDGSVRITDETFVSSPTTTWPQGRTSPVNFSFTSNIGTFSYTQSLTFNSPNRRIFSVSANRKNKTGIKRYGEIQWTWRGYFGSSTFSSLTPLMVTSSLSSQLMTQSIGKLTISGTQGYKYFAFPDGMTYSFTDVNFYNFPFVLATQGYTLIDNGNNYTTMTITNSYNIGTTYRLYRSMNQINGAITINLTK